MAERTWWRGGLLIALVANPIVGMFIQPTTGLTRASRSPFYAGVNLHPLQYNYAHYPAPETVGLASAIGASVVRIDIHWNWFEYDGPGEARWDPWEVNWLDPFLAEAARRHIRVLATVQDTPCWASSDPNKRCSPGHDHYHSNYPPADPRDYANFLTRLIDHAGTRIQWYEIWNEPNLERFWHHPDPVAYTRLLEFAYTAIKARIPAVHVVAGATAGADAAFVDGMYAAGARGYFDALSIHPYTGDRSPDDCSVPAHSFACGVEDVHQVMLRHEDRHPIWLTEFGVSLSKRVSRSMQATYVSRTLALIRHWRYVRGAIWYELFDDPTGHDRQRYGLFRGTLSPRPAAVAFCFSVASRVRDCSPKAVLRLPFQLHQQQRKHRHLRRYALHRP